MLVNLYDGVLLKDGRKGAIVEKYDGENFMVDLVDTDDYEWNCFDITINDIARVLISSNGIDTESRVG